MLPERNTGTVLMHLLDAGLLEENTALADARRTSGDLYGEDLSLIHVNPECPLVVGHRHGDDLHPVTRKQLNVAARHPRGIEQCHVCWQDRLCHEARTPQALTRFSAVREHLQVSAAVDDFFARPLPGTLAHRDQQRGIQRFLALCLQVLPPITDPDLVEVADLLARQQRRLEAWRPPLTSTLRSLRVRATENRSVPRAWAVISTARTPGDPCDILDVDRVIWSALGCADHYEAVPAGTGQHQVLARVPVGCLQSHDRWDQQRPRNPLLKLTERTAEFDASTIKGALALHPLPTCPLDDDLLDRVHSALNS